MKHEIINRIIKEVGAEHYLEIGYGNGANFDKIECKGKLATDPNLKNPTKNLVNLTSDEYFAIVANDYDVVFVDGLHHADQVRKDIINAMKCNAKAIILHDTIPHSEEMQKQSRTTKQWTGDCWRAAVGFIQSYPDVNVVTYRADYGLTVIYPNGKKVKKQFENKDLTYEGFKANEVELLNIID